MMKQVIAFICMVFVSSSAWSCGGDVDLSIPHIHDDEAFMDAAKQSKHAAPKTISIADIFGGQLSQEHKAGHGAEHKNGHSHKH
ncbi:hypothetical protein [Shewanella youngdeokensis]|uniref:Uncharacterized protein n=1 Tax=Shewanella youngdeokensis TaxID=2999068 RepID=A0ABZ0K400_9GAMM|nr:hypothetical protein RGE70_07265 [Shewanella sp. DAU334]